MGQRESDIRRGVRRGESSHKMARQTHRTHQSQFPNSPSYSTRDRHTGSAAHPSRPVPQHQENPAPRLPHPDNPAPQLPGDHDLSHLSNSETPANNSEESTVDQYAAGLALLDRMRVERDYGNLSYSQQPPRAVGSQEAYVQSKHRFHSGGKFGTSGRFNIRNVGPGPGAYSVSQPYSSRDHRSLRTSSLHHIVGGSMGLPLPPKLPRGPGPGEYRV